MAVIESLAGPSSRYRAAWSASFACLMVVGVASSLVFIRLSINLVVLVIVAVTYGSIHWDSDLTATMNRVGLAIHEEAVLGPLLDDLR